MEITSDLREYTEKHLRKVARVLRDRLEVHAILTAEKHRRIAEITVKCRDHVLVGVEETPDILTSIHGALDKLERQAVRLIERRRTRKRRPKPASAVLVNVLGAGGGNHEEHRVLETERIAIKPMTLEEAIESLDGTRAGIMVFRNNETERVNVIYRREDGNLGLIEPEP